MIESVHNAKVKYVVRLQTDSRFRRREGLFVIEGGRWIGDLVQAGIEPTTLYHTPEWDVSVLPHSWHCVMVSVAVMAKMSDVTSSAGVLAVVPISTPSIPSDLSWVLVVDRVQNPGNLGTMIRTAAAAGIDLILLSPDCVDQWNPKVVRGTMGALLHLPILVQTWEEIAETIKKMAIYTAMLETQVAYTTVDWSQPCALIIGNEACGVGIEAQALSHPITIPMANETESLNAAMAAGIILFEAARQRKILIS